MNANERINDSDTINKTLEITFSNLALSDTNGNLAEKACNLALMLKKQADRVDFDSVEKFLDKISRLIQSKALPREKELGALSFASIFESLGHPWEVYFFECMPPIFDLQSEKDHRIGSASTSAIKSLVNLIPPEAVGVYFLPFLCDYLGTASTKWQCKLAALHWMKILTKRLPEEITNHLITLIPSMTEAMNDSKYEVAKTAKVAMAQICTAVRNQDIIGVIPILVDCMANPELVDKCIQQLSSTTFVAEVTGPVIALLAPVLTRALKERSQDTLRRTVVVVENICKLIRHPGNAQVQKILPALLPGLERVINTAASPEVRHLAFRAQQTVIMVVEQARMSERATTVKQSDVFSLLQQHLTGLPKTKIILSITFYLSGIYCLYIHQSVFRQDDWIKMLDMYLGIFIAPDQVKTHANTILKHYSTHSLIDKLENNSEEEQILVDINLSLAYGGMMLLNNTNLTLIKGRRYGICAHNGAGKSTLLRAIAEGKLEGFPSKEELPRTFVEHNLQASESDDSVFQTLLNDSELLEMNPDSIRQKLLLSGFDETMQQKHISTLSGGWKMKLELMRAQMLNVEMLLLDEPTNHLDSENIKWLENYLQSNIGITTLVISHDSNFLDNICTDIIHYENHKLVYYKGNLSKFVEKHPRAKTYYSLSASNLSFKFPSPGILAGIKSRTKAILRMNNVSYIYPGATKPSLKNVSCAVSLSSRVGVVGPNGAGKSTLVKILTGELIPQEGQVEKHPNLRVGYVAQHAFHHVEQHLDLTPVQYIIWRYRFGEDREVLAKQTRIFTEEDHKQIEIGIEVHGSLRYFESITGRQKLNKSFQYEIKWKNLSHKYNSWISRQRLLDLGFVKFVQQFDDYEASREGLGSRELTVSNIRTHFEELGMNGDIAEHNLMRGLSGGQKVKVVIAAAMWNNPAVLILDEFTNYIDRDSLGGLSVAIRDWTGSVVMISHNHSVVSALSTEHWHLSDGRLTHFGKTSVTTDAFTDEITNGVIGKAKKKRKKTRNELKIQETRRRERHAQWLLSPPGTPKPIDSESD